jgi:hypothetical protein
MKNYVLVTRTGPNGIELRLMIATMRRLPRKSKKKLKRMGKDVSARDILELFENESILNTVLDFKPSKFDPVKY